jgi:hypothetical protein
MTPNERAEIRHGTVRLGLAIELETGPKPGPAVAEPIPAPTRKPWRASDIRALRFAGKRGMSLRWMAAEIDRTTAEVDVALWEMLGRPDWKAAEIMNRRSREGGAAEKAPAAAA